MQLRRCISAMLKRSKLDRSLRASLKRQIAFSQFGACADCVLVRTRVGAFLVDPCDLKIAKSLLDTASVNDEEIALLERLSSAGPSLLVVGGHYGTVAIPAARFFDDVKIVEANPKTALLLRDNVRLNALSEKVEVIEGAAAEKACSLTFLSNRVNSGGSKRIPKHQHAIYTFDADTITVDGLVLDQRLNQKPDVIFMDIEGSEFFALQGMQKLLRTAAYVSMEFMPHLIKNVAAISVEALVEQIPSSFDTLFFLRTHKICQGRDACLRALCDAYERGENHDHIIWLASTHDPAGLLEIGLETA
jgi:FkbM family methyltransferase